MENGCLLMRKLHLLRYCVGLLIALLLGSNASAGEIVVSKSKRTLEFKTSDTHRVFPIALGTNPVGKKLTRGDKKTPEGIYFITHKNPKSQFYLSLGISYPNIDDAKAGLLADLISKKEFALIEKAVLQKKLPPQYTKLGGEIFIHGGGASSDWTWGCIGLNNSAITFLFNHVSVGDKITILE